jgi:poly(3-hydroxybutyrate) depolymerase
MPTGAGCGIVLVMLRVALLSLVLFSLAWPARADELPGRSYSYEYDGKDVGNSALAWTGRVYLPPKAAAEKKALPLLVFLHGLNKELIPHRWMGGGREGDVRRIVGELVAKGAIPPLVIAGPSSTVVSQVARGASWNHFDLDGFVDRTRERLKGIAAIDERRIVVAGHSGAGCSDAGGLARLGESKRTLLAVVAIDTCMGGFLAERLGKLDPHTHVLVSYQSATWTSRPLSTFRRAFAREVAANPPAPGVLRELDHQRPERAAHDATVALTFERWLPAILR